MPICVSRLSRASCARKVVRCSCPRSPQGSRQPSLFSQPKLPIDACKIKSLRETCGKTCGFGQLEHNAQSTNRSARPLHAAMRHRIVALCYSYVEIGR
eukprot:5771266-Prymnesium_polylepis.2